MGKTKTNNNDEFGGKWTIEKLAIINEYLDFFTKALGKLNVKKIYVDAFAGSGKVELKDGREIEGSAIIALKYNFDEYHFVEIEQSKIESLRTTIIEKYPNKINAVCFYNGDCNIELRGILDKSVTPYTRSVIFLDPFSMEIDREIIEKVSKNSYVDLWLLFPLQALLRCLRKEGIPKEANRQAVSNIFGSDKWIEECYIKNPQLSLFEDIEFPENRIDYNKLRLYIENSLKNLFPNVHHFKLLTNEKNAPLFLLCFFMTNPSEKAKTLGSKGFKAVVDCIEKKINSGTLFNEE